ncbi:citrate synthase [Allobranchiibius sp. CTAmp26]|uniref:citrate synthase n=1 Tax=Allobranchiibius sp. CTAmp26 TaxID=2815214 RepID=UPI001AA1AA5E|nr:citrate synthase [Allobranchiibius sp. CTAmp26]MBO1755289.1 citrate synthase [Allobranchiibius sp. CTAmp26]
MDDVDLISTAAAAELLGVQVRTVYAYVSRGILTRGDLNGSRHDGSRFRRAEVLALAERHRRSVAGRFELTIDTRITSLIPEGVLLYRGTDATRLAADTAYERVAELLWESEEFDWAATSSTDAVACEVRRVCRPGATGADRVRMAVHLLHDRTPPTTILTSARFAQAGHAALLAGVAAVGTADGPSQGTLAERLGFGLLGRPVDTGETALLNAALVLLADHELATSTLAARTAAGTGAPPYLVVLAGLSALGGPRHGGASVVAESLLRQSMQRGARVAAYGEDGATAGFGHAVYRGIDPRAEALLGILEERCPQVVACADALRLEVHRRGGGYPNVDLALAALSVALDLPRGSGETIFSVARIAGFVAHGIEEQGHPLRFRPRAIYTGD